MLEMKTYTCTKCGKSFTKTVGGVTMTLEQMELELRPVCDKCRRKQIINIFK